MIAGEDIKKGDIVVMIDGKIYRSVVIKQKPKRFEIWNCCAGNIPVGEKCRICGDSE